MYVERHAVPITTDGAGNATAYTPVVTGRVLAIYYSPGASPLDTGADLTVTEEETGLPVVTKANIGTAAFTIAPRMPTHAVADGSALLYAVGGTAQSDFVPIANSRIKFVIAQGAATKTGTFYVWVG